jgi:hypothetical protein
MSGKWMWRAAQRNLPVRASSARPQGHRARANLFLELHFASTSKIEDLVAGRGERLWGNVSGDSPWSRDDGQMN